MSIDRIEPDLLTPAELDEYLARGWYRIGYRMITTDLLLWEDELRSTIWTRLDVRGHRFPRSLRKLIAENSRLFQARVAPAVIDDEREQLYARYLEKVGGERAENLADVVGGERGRALFDTREVSVWSGERLIAFSWYDLGVDSAQSVIGVYDPAFSRHSLGLYTMLLEILHTAELGMRYHYAGYVLGEPSSMDYKLRVGGLQFFDPVNATWLPEPPFAPSQSPAEVMRRKLAEAEDALRRAGVEAVRPYRNPSLRYHGLLDNAPQCPKQPLLLVCPAAALSWAVLVAWEPRGVYSLVQARAVVATLDRGVESEGSPRVDILLFIVEETLAECHSAEEVALLVRVHLD